MEIKRTSQELLSTYARLRHTAQTLDQSELDNNRQDDYVNITFSQVKPEEGQWGLHGTRQINSHPETVTKQTVDGLISRKTEVKKFAIMEAQFAETNEGPVRHSMDFVDDGRSLRVTESLTRYDEENFLASEQQSYVIYHKSGKMRTLKPKSNGPVNL